MKADSPEDARARLAALAPSFRKALVQGHVPGRGVGAFFLLHEGRVLAEFMHRRLHEVPYTGGASSFRESWFHAGIRDDALAKLRHLGWQGVAMMEYRWDERTGAFSFLEMNGRFWGSLHLALYAGVDFPRLLLDAFLGHPPEPVRVFPRGVRSRITIPDELKHVVSKVRDPALEVRDRLWPLLEFLLLSADPRVHSDLLFPGDRGLYWDGLVAGVRELIGQARRRARGWRDAEPEAEDHPPAGRENARAVPSGAVADAR